MEKFYFDCSHIERETIIWNELVADTSLTNDGFVNRMMKRNTYVKVLKIIFSKYFNNDNDIYNYIYSLYLGMKKTNEFKDAIKLINTGKNNDELLNTYVKYLNDRSINGVKGMNIRKIENDKNVTNCDVNALPYRIGLISDEKVVLFANSLDKENNYYKRLDIIIDDNLHVNIYVYNNINNVEIERYKNINLCDLYYKIDDINKVSFAEMPNIYKNRLIYNGLFN